MTEYGYKYDISFGSFDKTRMAMWRAANKIQHYTNATYKGHTGAKEYYFPTILYSKNKFLGRVPDITRDLHTFEENVFQELKDTKRKPFGFFRVLWKMCRNFGTGERWDTKFLPAFPGRDKNGRVQYARYNDQIVTGNDVSNIFFGHTCKFLGIPEKLSLWIARLDASGILEPFSKGKFPSKELLNFRDTHSDQQAIVKGMREFDINNYRLRNI